MSILYPKDECKIKETKYTQHEVNKKILAKYQHPRHEYDILGPQDLYRDEYLSCYKNCKLKYKDAVQRYKKSNERALVTDKPVICQVDPCDIMEKVVKESRECKGCFQKSNRDEPGEGRLIRKRTLREIHEKLKMIPIEMCSMEPWFRRYLILSKFIRAVRGLILKKRLIDRLIILKSLKKEDVEELEKKHRKCYNVSYGELFEKFL